MKTLIVKMKDSSTSQQKFEFLLELLRGLPDVEVEVQRGPDEVVAQEPASDSDRASAEADFWAMAGMWKERDVDANDLRQRAWQRGNGGS